MTAGIRGSSPGVPRVPVPRDPDDDYTREAAAARREFLAGYGTGKVRKLAEIEECVRAHDLLGRNP